MLLFYGILTISISIRIQTGAEMNLLQKKSYYKEIFYFVMIASIILMFIIFFATHGRGARGILFYNNQDSFMDHFNSVIYATAEDPYANYVLYPPLAMLFYSVMGNLVPAETYDKYVTDPAIIEQSQALKIDQGFMYGFMLFAVICGIMFIFTLNEFKKGKKAEKILFTFVTLLSAPFLFMMDRGNNIIIPLIFSMIYLIFYDSENKVLREVALISLAIAVGFKIYPAALGALLLREKYYKELFRTILYSILLTVVPFFIFYNGFESIGYFFSNIAGSSDKRALNDTNQLNFSKMFLYVINVLRIRIPNAALIADIINYTVTGLAVIGVFSVKEKWKSVLLCCCIIYGFPKVCASYMLVFFLLPLVMFLDNEKERKLINYFYLLCLICMFIPIPVIAATMDVWTRYAMEKISSFAVGAVTFVAVAEGFRNIYTLTKAKISKKKLQEGTNEIIS